MFHGLLYKSLSRKRGFRALHIQRAANGLRNGFRLVQSQESKSFLKQVRSPGHLLFFASNLGLLLHVRYVSTQNREAEMEKLRLQRDDLENYEEVIKSLDAQEEAVRAQIAILKSEIAEKKSQVTRKDHSKAQAVPLSRRDFLRQTYASQRAAISSAFSEETNINQLFQRHHQLRQDEISDEQESSFSNRTHTSSILPSLMMLSNMLIKSCLVEINLRKAFDDSAITKLYSAGSYLLCPNLFQSMKNDETKEHLYAKLMRLRGRNHTLDNPIWRHLDEDTLVNLRDGFQHSDHFRSRELIRLDFYLYKSGRFLNYERANKSRYIMATQAPIFHSDIQSSAAYIKDFKSYFAIYEGDDHPLKHLNFVLSIARRLLRDGECAPLVSIFKELLDLFGRAELQKYQTLVYETLPGFEDMESVLANGEEAHEFAKKKARNFARAIREDASILGSLIEFQVVREDSETLEQILQYLEPTQDISNENSFILPAFMTTWERSPAMPESILSRMPSVSASVIETALEGCIKLRQYGSIDKILGKLVYDLVQDTDGIRIALYSGVDENTRICRISSELSARILLFNEKIILLLGKAYIESGDKLRCKWLASIISDRLRKVPSHNLEKLQAEIFNFTRCEAKSIPNTRQESKSSIRSGPNKRDKGPVLFDLAGDNAIDAERSRHVSNPPLHEVYVT